jgi:3-isopropylmalate dehydrogenase
MLLRYSFGLEREARAIEAALEKVLISGIRTADLEGTATTQQGGDAVAAALSGTQE